MPTLRDIRYAIRALRGAPTVSALAIVSIGLGIGAVTTVYSTATAFTFRPLPQMTQAGELMMVAEAPRADRQQASTVTAGTFQDLRDLPEFQGVAAFVNWSANLAGFDLTERVTGARVSAHFFEVAGRAAALGRTFTANDVREDQRVVILSAGLWQRRFGADPGIVGRSIQVNGEGHLVVGVMPDDFVFPAGAKIWAPLALPPAAAGDRTTRSLLVIARRASGVSSDRAGAAVAALGDRLSRDHPDTHQGWTLRAVSAEEFFGAGPRPFMIAMLASVAFLLLIACANVANLLLARATARRLEMGQRLALGATRGQLIRQLLTESLLLALAGGVLGIGLAWLGIKGTSASVPLEVQQYIPGFGAIALDVPAMTVAALVALLAGVVFGLAPALSGSAVDLTSALRGGGRSDTARPRQRLFRHALVVGEIALALMLVVGAALMGVSFLQLSKSDPGFKTDRRLTGTVSLPEADYASDTLIVNYWNRLRESLAGRAGVASAELTSVLPMSWNDSRVRVYPEGQAPDRPENAPSAGFRRVSSGYLHALEVPAIAGRRLAETDRADAPLVVVLSESAARRLLPGRDAVGQRLVIRTRVAEVVGVVRDVRGNPLTSDAPTALVYAPLAQWPVRTMSVVLETQGEDATAWATTLQQTIAELDPRLAAGEVATMTRVIDTVVSPQSATAQVLVASAFIALLMAVVGTYGVMAYTVARRTREIGVRVALGATTSVVVRDVLGSATSLAAVGVVLGLAGAYGLGRSMQAILVDTDPADPGILGGAALLIIVMALVAGFLPAYKASRIDPVTALRAE